MDNRLSIREQNELSATTAQIITAAVKEIVGPVMQSLALVLKQNTDAIEQIASTQQVMTERIVALEKQMRLGNKVSKKQAQYITDAIKSKAKEILGDMGVTDDRKAVNQLKGHIRKGMLKQWGVSSVNDLPSCEYQVVMNHIGFWFDVVVIQEVVRESRKRAEKGG